MRIAFLASARPGAQAALGELVKAYGQADIAEADCLVAIGGDGTTLRALHAAIANGPKPVFAMRHGASVGYLGNPFRQSDLAERLAAAARLNLHPLRVCAEDTAGSRRTFLTINDAALLRATRLTAKLRVSLGGAQCQGVFAGDGIIVATPIGSTAYNRSAGGPLLPVGSRLLAVTGIAPYAGKPWSPTAIEDRCPIGIEVLTPAWRPVRLETDVGEARDIVRAEITLARDVTCALMFDADIPPERGWTID